MIEDRQFYRATVCIRRGSGWPVKPEAEVLDGRRLLLLAVGTSDDGRYCGEHWMSIIDGSLPDDAPIALASGDLTDVAFVPFAQGLEMQRMERMRRK